MLAPNKDHLLAYAHSMRICAKNIRFNQEKIFPCIRRSFFIFQHDKWCGTLSQEKNGSFLNLMKSSHKSNKKDVCFDFDFQILLLTTETFFTFFSANYWDADQQIQLITEMLKIAYEKF